MWLGAIVVALVLWWFLPAVHQAQQKAFVARRHDIESMALYVSPRRLADAGAQERILHGVKRLGGEVVDVTLAE